MIFLAFVWKCASILRILQSADNSRQFPSKFKHIKWLTDNIGHAVSFASPHPRLSNPQNQINSVLHIAFLWAYFANACCTVTLLPQDVFWNTLQSVLIYNKCMDGGNFSRPTLKSPCRNGKSSLWAGNTRVTDMVLQNKPWTLQKHPVSWDLFQKPFKKIGKCIHWC